MAHNPLEPLPAQAAQTAVEFGVIRAPRKSLMVSRAVRVHGESKEGQMPCLNDHAPTGLTTVRYRNNIGPASHFTHTSAAFGRCRECIEGVGQSGSACSAQRICAFESCFMRRGRNVITKTLKGFGRNSNQRCSLLSH